MSTLDVAAARAAFPAISKSNFIFADNAGGSACCKEVIDRLTDYLSNTNVQLGADYSVSVSSTTRVASGPVEIAKIFNAASPEEVVFGSSSTQNLENLSLSLDGAVKEGTEIIITGEHEANNGPWKKLAKRNGGVVKYWEPTPLNPNNLYSVGYKIEELILLITAKTRFVAITACSNILGSLTEVKKTIQAIRETAKKVGAEKVEISVDCVAYAPHRRIDVQDWDVDFCVFSVYKVYGAHLSALYVRRASLQNVASLAHYFKKFDGVADAMKLQPGGTGYELVYASGGIVTYLESLTPAKSIEATYKAIADHEDTLVKPLLDFLTAPEQRERGVRIVGDEKAGPTRAPTISFVVVGERAVKSKEIVKVFDQTGEIFIRYGHFYAHHLLSNLLHEVEDGVVRISLVHYNTAEEVQRIIEILKKALA